MTNLFSPSSWQLNCHQLHQYIGWSSTAAYAPLKPLAVAGSQASYICWSSGSAPFLFKKKIFFNFQRTLLWHCLWLLIFRLTICFTVELLPIKFYEWLQLLARPSTVYVKLRSLFKPCIHTHSLTNSLFIIVTDPLSSRVWRCMVFVLLLHKAR